jgi:putative glycosyltransferase (TIGR04372 family)
MKMPAKLRRSLANLARRLPRRLTLVGAVLLTAGLYGWLLLGLRAREAKLALSKFFPGGKRKTRKGDGWISRLLLYQLRGIESLQQRIGERAPVQERISKSLGRCGGVLSATARLSLAEKFFAAAVRRLPPFSELRLDYMRTLGVLRFMQGKMRDAMPCFAEVAETKHFLRTRCGAPRNLRILGESWFVALGHVAMIDFLLKKQKLGWEEADTVFLTTRDLRAAPGQTLLRELQHLGVLLAFPENIETIFRQIIEARNRKQKVSQDVEVRQEIFRENGAGNGAAGSSFDPRQPRDFNCLESVERAALVEEFWEIFFPDGQGLPYSHAAAKIQNRWEAENRPPLFARREECDTALRVLRRRLGIPEDAWYACLHVREPSFHSGWNKVWEQARDADIRTYSAAVRTIVQWGGYVIRMGDPSMPPLPPVNGAIDYARSELKCEYADILLLSGARFFVGTNSGLSVVPGIYGVPCVLTNWVPIALPNWFGKDLMIPKLLRYKGSRDVVSLEEMFGSNLGYVQNPRDLPLGLEFVDNTPEELAAVVTQMLYELEGKADQLRDRVLEDAYFAMAVRHGSYRGSRIGTAFMREHGGAVGFSWKKEVSSNIESQRHVRIES